LDFDLEEEKPMSRPFYEDGRVIADLLTREGEEEVAKKLREVIDGASTGTEIAMGLRFHCKEALDAGRTGDATTTARVRQFVETLAAALE